MQTHYNTFNGRTFVHTLVSLVTRYGHFAFALSVFLTLAVFSAAILKLCRWERKTSAEEKTKSPAEKIKSAAERIKPAANIISRVLLFLLLIMLLPSAFFVKGFLWISAFFNYVFPVALIILLFSLLSEKDWEKRYAVRLICLLILSFLCGATTEQTGFSACLGIFILFIFEAVVSIKSHINNDMKSKKSVIVKKLVLLAACGLSSFGGLLTVMFSPATQNRFAEETEASKGFWEMLGEYRLLLSGENLAVLIVFVLAAVMSLAVIKKTRLPLFLVTVGAASFGIMLFTNTAGERCLLPAYLYACSAIVVSGCCLPKHIIYRSCIAFACLAAVNIYPLACGMINNFKIDQENQRLLDAGPMYGKLALISEVDTKYCYTYFYDFYELSYLLKSKNIDIDCNDVEFRNDYGTVYINGTRLASQTVKINSNYLFRLRDVADAAGITISLINDNYCIMKGDEAIPFIADTKGIRIFSPPDNEWKEYEGCLSIDTTYVSEKFLEDVMGFSFSKKDSAGNINIVF